MIDKAHLIKNPENKHRHIVLLGAGASRAAFFKGDAHGQKLPVMSDIVNILDLTSFLQGAGIDPANNFELIYANLASNSANTTLLKDINNRIDDYFSLLELPDTATHYDRLILSLRQKDTIYSFNWDPFLFDAYRRNCSVFGPAFLPNIFFLHGNVRIASCTNDGSWGAKGTRCPKCSTLFTNVPLLYPINQKDYFLGNLYTKSAWEDAKDMFAQAFTLTIFGYGAPTSDTEAVTLLRNAWLAQSERKLEHVEVIDTTNTATLYDRWRAFIPTSHLLPVSNFERSRLSRWPRRSCESLFYPMSKGFACEEFPLPETDNLGQLHKYISQIVEDEEPTK